MMRLLLIGFTISFAVASGPLVTLSHGGQLQGKQFLYDNTLKVDLFLGVRYAAAPIGDLRFKKTVASSSWTGIQVAKTPGDACPQMGPNGTPLGDEDCLFLDITVPGGVDPANRKPVMVWIHGGSYISGSKGGYLGAPLAVTGDVIIVAINYRLHILGFLSEGNGTGNFGLWDQRAALVWVKENIAQFGGDPNMVTVFGESAGAGSVAAQMMSPHNDGLFKRAIQESGSLYQDWGWYLSDRRIHEVGNTIKKHQKCTMTESAYKCLHDLRPHDLLTLDGIITGGNPSLNPWHPTPDNDFFPSNISDKTYDLSKRFDLLAGFNGQEGVLMTVAYFLKPANVSLADGISASLVNKIVYDKCVEHTPLSVELCVQFRMKAYGLNDVSDAKERGRRLTYMLGENSFNADIVHQLAKHSPGTKSTYGYWFTENYSPLPEFNFIPDVPSWIKIAASHVDEVPFVFGAPYFRKNTIWKEYLGDSIPEDTQDLLRFMNGTTDGDKPLTDLLMTLWTNFARSGNPNQPASLPAGAPVWPEFDTNSNQFMELNSSTTQVITTPHKERLEAVFRNVLEAQAKQVLGDKAPDSSCVDYAKLSKGKDSVFG